MNLDLFTKEVSSMNEVLNGVSGVSGAAIVTSSDYEVIVVSSPEELSSVMQPISSLALCSIIVFLYVYKKFLQTFVRILSLIFRRA